MGVRRVEAADGRARGIGCSTAAAKQRGAALDKGLLQPKVSPVKLCLVATLGTYPPSGPIRPSIPCRTPVCVPRVCLPPHPLHVPPHAHPPAPAGGPCPHPILEPPVVGSPPSRQRSVLCLCPVCDPVSVCPPAHSPTHVYGSPPCSPYCPRNEDPRVSRQEQAPGSCHVSVCR